MGNSNGIILPKPILEQLGIGAGDSFDLTVEDGSRIVLVRSVAAPRAGWADAARTIADAHDDALVWPDFANAGDADLAW
jgi:antitoxin MazE